MENLFLRVKGIVKKDDKYLVIKRWMDDRIPDPFVWEFVDGEVSFGESPNDAMERILIDTLGVYGKIERVSYVWSQMIADTQCVGIAYICSIDDAEEDNFVLSEEFGGFEWISREQFDYYIENTYVLKDLEKADL
ncbi:MAG: NUDIX domain-containing protein [Lachnospiraceae bacterium]|nr:NUDIX domain-containing protein [Candidatus Merdinaster equi]